MADINSYRSILKGTSLLGGVQVFQILVNLVRGKFVAMFLGPEGMGAAAMFNSAHNTIMRFSSLGMNLAFVKEMAAHSGDETHLSAVRHVAGMILRVTASLGALACLLLSPWLSMVSFGSTEYSWQFMLLAVAIFFSVGADGKSAMLQGLHKVRVLSLTSLIGALCGLLVGVPLYYFFGEKGIVPAMVVLFICTYSFFSYGLRKALPAPRGMRFNRRLHWPMIRRMLASGIVLLASSLINTLFTYLVNIFIRSHGNLDDVGLFNAANGVTLQYAGVVFAAMAMDYFPRLSAASGAGDEGKMWRIVCRQMEIVALIATPMSILLIATAPFVIRLLLTPEFLPTTQLMRWFGASILLKAISYPLGYIAFAKDNRRLFFWMEAVGCNLLYLCLSLIFYNSWGLMGLGYAAVVENACVIVLYMTVNRSAYGFRPDLTAWKETVIAILFGCAGFCLASVTEGPLSAYLLSGLLLLCATRSFLTLRTRIKGE